MNSVDNEEDEALLDKQLHYEIAAASDNIILIQMLNAISALVEDFINEIRKSILSKPENKARLRQIHHDIVTAIINKDKDAIRSSLTEHSNIINENLRYAL